MNDYIPDKDGSLNYRPLLSLIMIGRNDNYMGDFKWRLTTSCNYMANSLAAIGRPGAVEIVVGDWNSDIPMYKELVLTAEAHNMVRFVVVPPNIAFPAQKDSIFPGVIVFNVGVRRAWGEYIGLMNSDVLYTPRVC